MLIWFDNINIKEDNLVYGGDKILSPIKEFLYSLGLIV
jgi:hypothetical protein